MVMAPSSGSAQGAQTATAAKSTPSNTGGGWSGSEAGPEPIQTKTIPWLSRTG